MATAKKRLIEPYDPRNRRGMGRAPMHPEVLRETLRGVMATTSDSREYKRAKDSLDDLAKRDAQKRAYVTDDEEADPYRVTARDALSVFPARLRQAGLQLRAHKQGLIISTAISGGFSVQFIDGGEKAGAEHQCDLRRVGYHAWQRALDAITPRKRAGDRIADYHMAFTKCVEGSWPLTEACFAVGYRSDAGTSINEVKRFLSQGLEAAADYLAGVR